MLWIVNSDRGGRSASDRNAGTRPVCQSLAWTTSARQSSSRRSRASCATASLKRAKRNALSGQSWPFAPVYGWPSRSNNCGRSSSRSGNGSAECCTSSTRALLPSASVSQPSTRSPSLARSTLRYAGSTTRTSTPSSISAAGRLNATSASPPVLISGKHSLVANRTRMLSLRGAGTPHPAEAVSPRRNTACRATVRRGPRPCRCYPGCCRRRERRQY